MIAAASMDSVQKGTATVSLKFFASVLLAAAATKKQINGTLLMLYVVVMKHSTMYQNINSNFGTEHNTVKII